MNRFILFILLASSFLVGYSQRTAKVSATYTYYAPETMSVEEAKRVALDRAKIQAIADEFGTIVSQSTSTIITNKNGESDTQFLALGGSDVKGEWIETIGNPEYQLRFETHFLVVTCSVKGKAREITQNKIDFIAKPLRNGTSLKYESTDFRNGDDLYVFFSASENGYLAIYLVQNDKAYRLLPYKKDDSQMSIIHSNTSYVFFSRENMNDNTTVEYQLYAEVPSDIAYLTFIYSPTYITNLLTHEENKYEPFYIDTDKFNHWLVKVRKEHTDCNIMVLPIKISI